MRTKLFSCVSIVATLTLLGLLYARADDQHKHDAPHGHEARRASDGHETRRAATSD